MWCAQILGELSIKSNAYYHLSSLRPPSREIPRFDRCGNHPPQTLFDLISTARAWTLCHSLVNYLRNSSLSDDQDSLKKLLSNNEAGAAPPQCSKHWNGTGTDRVSHLKLRWWYGTCPWSMAFRNEGMDATITLSSLPIEFTKPMLTSAIITDFRARRHYPTRCVTSVKGDGPITKATGDQDQRLPNVPHGGC